MSRATAVVFAYGDVGVRCLEVLCAGGVDVRLVVTHADDPAEARWFASVAETARRHGLPCIAPTRADDPALLARLDAAPVDFLFSFYYRQLLPAAVLTTARRGALNMHGSLLPKYRGRAPVNWAIIHGERETGATLHHMVARADAGDIVDQQSVPILPDDLAIDVARRVAEAAAAVLTRSLPALLAGTAPRRPQRLESGSYVGRRTPEDGRIDWTQPAQRIHDLVRAVAPPFPGAFTEAGGERVWIHRTRVADAAPGVRPGGPPVLQCADGRCFVSCGSGLLEILAAADRHGSIDPAALAARMGATPLG